MEKALWEGWLKIETGEKLPSIVAEFSHLLMNQDSPYLSI